MAPCTANMNLPGATDVPTVTVLESPEGAGAVNHSTVPVTSAAPPTALATIPAVRAVAASS